MRPADSRASLPAGDDLRHCWQRRCRCTAAHDACVTASSRRGGCHASAVARARRGNACCTRLPLLQPLGIFIVKFAHFDLQMLLQRQACIIFGGACCKRSASAPTPACQWRQPASKDDECMMQFTVNFVVWPCGLSFASFGVPLEGRTPRL